jgi:hypothetical protein
MNGRVSFGLRAVRGRKDREATMSRAVRGYVPDMKATTIPKPDDISTSNDRGLESTEEGMSASDWMRRMLVVAVWSILLGIVIQVLIMLATMKWPANPLAETAQKVTWSTMVCSALAIGTSLRKALPGVMGVLGMISAPAAFYAARAAQKSLNAGVSGAGPAVPTAMELAIMKGVQYAIFGVLIALVASKRGLKAHLAVGAGIGLAGMCYVMGRLVTGNSPMPPTPALLSRGINEAIFPIGCAVVLWVAMRIGTQAKASIKLGPMPEV